MIRLGEYAGSTVEKVFLKDPKYVVRLTMFLVNELYRACDDNGIKNPDVPFSDPHRVDANELVIRRILAARNTFDYRPDVEAAERPGSFQTYGYSICLQIRDRAWWDTLVASPLAEQKKMILSEQANFMDVADCCNVKGINTQFFERLQLDVDNPEAVAAARALCSAKKVCLQCARIMTKASAATPNTGYNERFIHKMCWFRIRQDYLYCRDRDYEGPDIPCKHKETPEQREQRQKWQNLLATSS